MKSKPKRRSKGKSSNNQKPLSLRIIGGDLGGRKISYSGDPQVRPMKDRTREAVFNLVGPSVKGKHAIDLFAGTGAMAIEAISRGAHSATLIERHLPSARLVRENLATLNLTGQATLFEADAFIWMQDKSDALPRDQPWLTFICPPYRFFRERFDDMLTIVTWFALNSPPNSIMMVEAEIPFDFEQFASLGEWNVRTYRPAVVGKLV